MTCPEAVGKISPSRGAISRLQRLRFLNPCSCVVLGHYQFVSFSLFFFFLEDKDGLPKKKNKRQTLKIESKSRGSHSPLCGYWQLVTPH